MLDTIILDFLQVLEFPTRAIQCSIEFSEGAIYYSTEIMLNIHPKLTYEVGDINEYFVVVLEVDFRYGT